MPIEFDKYGHCVLCHRDLRYEQVVNGEPIIRFDTDYCETEYLLDDGSKMRVAMCKPCKEKLTNEDTITIMDCVKAGWVEETKKLSWSDEKKQDYITTYLQREIICSSEGIPQDVLTKAHLDYKKAKVKPVKLDKKVGK